MLVALAFWLARAGHHVTVIERFPALRAGGSQIDLHGAGIEVCSRPSKVDPSMNPVRLLWIPKNVKATIMANKTSQGAQTLTSEYEIMRGDLMRIIYEATKDNVHYIFGKTVDSFDQDEEQVTAHFSDGSSDTYDLLIGADGQGSRIRRVILSPDSSNPYYRFRTHIAYWFIQRIDSDTNMKIGYNCPGGRMIMGRSHNSTETQAFAGYLSRIIESVESLD